MKSLSDVMDRSIIQVEASRTVSTAMALLLAHNLPALPVMQSGRLVGLLTPRYVLGIEGDCPISQVMRREFPRVRGDLSIREGADLLLADADEALAVVDEENNFLGLVTERELLAELRRSSDPLTDLSWSDTLREWGIEQLRHGREITVLFLDVNDFGLFNKQYGHVVGDMVLRQVAEAIRAAIDPARDVACRYGGDEFCMASLRGLADAEMLGETIKMLVLQSSAPPLPEAAVRIAVGVRGGRRNRERDKTHYAATMNSLINLASRECLLRKIREREASAISLAVPTFDPSSN